MRDIVLNKTQRHEQYIKTHLPQLYDEIKAIDGVSWQEKLYKYIYELNEVPKCRCGKDLKFVGYARGYSKFCCAACANRFNSDQVKKTKLNKYGTTGYNNRQKAAQTCLERYGVSVASQSDEIRKKLSRPMPEQQKALLSQIYHSKHESAIQAIENKRRLTCIERFGKPNAMQNSDIVKKCIDSFIDSQGCGFRNNLRIRQLSKEGIKRKTQLKYPEFIDYTEDGNWICRCPHPKCDKCQSKTYITPPSIHRDRVRLKSELCTTVMPIAQNIKDTSIEIFIRNILEEHRIPYISNCRDIISPYELDIYIPSRKLAIECNGVYWHSTKVKSQYGHNKKFKLCRNIGIQLLTIWEDWIVNKPEIVKSLLLSKLGIAPQRIYARKCNISEIDYKAASQFLDANHIQGKCQPGTNVGLFYNDELVSVMCFNKRSKLSGPKTNNGGVELIRFCNKLNTTVVGGASKLLKYYITHYHPQRIVSFSSNDISNGNLYKTLGFITDNESVGYWYISPDMKRYHRSSFTKDQLIKKGLAPTDKSTWTEGQIMAKLPYLKIYDSGAMRWILELPG